MEDQIYNWVVRKGNILIQKNKDCISLKLDYENGECCLLTHSDTEEIIELLTIISARIWQNPDYKRKPYTHPFYKKNGSEYYWEIDASQLLLSYNGIEDAIEIRCNGNSSLDLEINYVVEIVQILGHLKGGIG
jgi:hypothetical protein